MKAGCAKGRDLQQQQAFAYTQEDLVRVIVPYGEGKDPVGAMVPMRLWQFLKTTITIQLFLGKLPQQI